MKYIMHFFYPATYLETLNFHEGFRKAITEQGLPVISEGICRIHPKAEFNKINCLGIEYLIIGTLHNNTEYYKMYLCIKPQDSKIYEVSISNGEIEMPTLINKDLYSYWFYVRHVYYFIELYKEMIQTNIRIHGEDITIDFESLLSKLGKKDSEGLASKFWQAHLFDIKTIALGDYFSGVAYGEDSFSWKKEKSPNRPPLEDHNIPF